MSTASVGMAPKSPLSNELTNQDTSRAYRNDGEESSWESGLPAVRSFHSQSNEMDLSGVRDVLSARNGDCVGGRVHWTMELLAIRGGTPMLSTGLVHLAGSGAMPTFAVGMRRERPLAARSSHRLASSQWHPERLDGPVRWWPDWQVRFMEPRSPVVRECAESESFPACPRQAWTATQESFGATNQPIATPESDCRPRAVSGVRRIETHHGSVARRARGRDRLPPERGK
ncbi:hypothetical protein Pan216_27890 [Planctomycetes bacterium Pan216]|uniref:Uncharacterized protein n=1 Tax=Kolteria novifilia TaxID=2527975 RepID=A0A518B4N8_9BACT|nr:hypothetical protein Pan216_27890 [Planctomycetes bacterium Pan216]